MSIDFSLRDFFHPLEIGRIRRKLDRTQWLPPEELREFQLGLLKELLVHAGTSVPYYRNLGRVLGLRLPDDDPLETLSRLPLLRKPTVREYHDRLQADNAERYGLAPYSTSGTSGRPLHFFLDRRSNALEFVYYWRYWGWGGYRLGDKFAELTTHFFLKRPALGDRAAWYQPHLRRLLINSGHLSPQVAKEAAAAFRLYRPRFLKGIASALYCLALALREAHCDEIKLQCVFSTGELLSDTYRGVITETFGCPVLDSYGHMERTVAICQCPEGSYHVNSDYGLLEFEDLQETPQGIRVGKAVGTSLHNFAMPFIRYDIGDEIELFPADSLCPCGRTLPLVKRIRGRTVDVVVTPDGRYITTLFIIPEMVAGIRLAQFVQTSRAVLQVNYVPAEDWTDATDRLLVSDVERLVGPAMEVKVEKVGMSGIVRDRSGKLRPVIALRM